MKYELSREEQVMLVVMHSAKEMARHGMLQYAGWDVTEEGDKLAKELLDGGFRPTEEEMEKAVAALALKLGLSLVPYEEEGEV